LQLGGPTITVGANANLATPDAAGDALAQVNASLTNVTAAVGTLGAQSDQISAQTAALGQSVDGVPIDTNLNADSARLQALQVQQQLSAQSSPIASQAPSVILSLFR
jgi:flagellin